MDLEIDKLTEQYTLKIPEILKVAISSLTPEQKKKLNLQIMFGMAKAIHDSRFDPEAYLTAREG
ncbi:hypothetical protein [Desulfospira joergensenii]|uniref:hypothetical protein n=1 Tax=Desulfospira joergensenii TaxID=53329 RepID=UPI00129474DE|nr:hypothetical protein [Desulfospira joergensenii]